MAVTMRNGAPLTRRRLLTTAASSAAITMRAASPSPISAARRTGRSSPTASSRATSRSIPAWSGRAPIGPRACWSRSRPPTASSDIRSAVASRRAAGDRFHREGAARGPAGRTGHLLSRPLRGSVARRRSSANRRSDASAPRRATGARSRSCGRATPPAGLGHRRGARRHAHLRDHAAKTGRTSSSIPATTSMPTARSRRS